MTGSIKSSILNHLRLPDPHRNGTKLSHEIRTDARIPEHKDKESILDYIYAHFRTPHFQETREWGKRGRGAINGVFLSFIGGGSPPVGCFQAKRQKIQRLSFSLLFPAFYFLHSLTVVSVAATPQIAEVNSTSSINRPTLKVGSQGESVTELQAALKLLGFYKGTVDGIYNNITASAVSRFKQSVGLNPDGVVDASTWQQLFPNESIAASSVSSPNSASKFPLPSQTSNTSKVANPSPQPRPATPNTASRSANTSSEPRPATPNTITTRSANTSSEPRPATPSTNTNSQKPSGRQSSPTSSQSTISHPTIQYTSEGYPILRVGMHGSEVVKLQQRLQKLGFLEDNIDGDFGAKTEVAVKAAQQRYGLEADGVVGGGTWVVLMRRS